MTKVRRLATCARFGRDIISVLTNFFIDGMALIDFKGRIALSDLIDEI